MTASELRRLPAPSQEQVSLDHRGLCQTAVAHGKTVYGLSDAKITWKVTLKQPISTLVASTNAWVIAITEDHHMMLLHEGKTILEAPMASSSHVSWLFGNVLGLQLANSWMLVTIGDDILQSEKPMDCIRMETIAIDDNDGRLGFWGHELRENVLRVLAVDGEGRIVVQDYHRDTKQWDADSKQLLNLDDTAQHWQVDHEIGFRRQSVNGQLYVVCTATCQDRAALFWLDPLNASTVCRFDLPMQKKQRGASCNVLDVVPVTALDGTVAVAVASKNWTAKSTFCQVRLVQVATEETLGLTVLSNPHCIYTVDMPVALSLTLAAIVSTPFAFRCKVWTSASTCEYYQFSPSAAVSQTVARFRLLLVRNDLAGLDKESVDWNLEDATNDPFTNFHSSEEWLKRLQLSLQGIHKGDETVKDYLSRMAVGAVSDNSKAKESLIGAAKSIDELTKTKPVAERLEAFQAAVACFDQVIIALSDEEATPFRILKESMDERIRGLDALQTVEEHVSLDSAMDEVRSPADLYALLINEKKFDAALRLGFSKHRLSSEELVLPLLSLSGSFDKDEIINLLQRLIFVNLTIGDPIVMKLRGWACRLADSFDDNNAPGQDLEAALEVLSTVDKETKKLRAKQYASFSIHCPFTERSPLPGRRPTQQSGSTTESSLSSYQSDTVTSDVKESKKVAAKKAPAHPYPTLMEGGALKTGALKRLAKRQVSTSDETYDDTEACVEIKMLAAKCLLAARKVGLPHSSFVLRQWSEDHDAKAITRTIIRLTSEEADDHDMRQELLNKKVLPFCQEFLVPFDDMLLADATALCRSKRIAPSVIEEAASLARCCTSPVPRCRTALLVIRGAMLCKACPDSIAKLASDAIVWAVIDSSLQSEIEEATRLLSVNRIVIKYCGFSSTDLFQVGNPAHALRLLRFVCKRVADPDVVEDALDLCKAFHHLQIETAASTIVCHCIDKADQNACQTLMERIANLGASVMVRVVTDAVLYCDERVKAGTNERSEIVERLQVVLQIAAEKRIVLDADTCNILETESLEDLRMSYQSMMKLERDYDTTINRHEFGNPSFLVGAMTKIIQNTMPERTRLSDFRVSIAKARKACDLLSPSKCDELWSVSSANALSAILKDLESNDVLAIACELGLRNATRHSASSLRKIAEVCCMVAVRESSASHLRSVQYLTLAKVLVQDWVLPLVDKNDILKVIELESILDLVCSVLKRADEGVGEKLEVDEVALQRTLWKETSMEVVNASSRFRPSLHETWYVGDGLLLPPDVALDQVIAFASSLMGISDQVEESACEIIDLLTDRGAHTLAYQVLSFWVGQQSQDQNKSGTLVPAFTEREEHTLRCLVERYLGGSSSGITNATVDSQLAVAFLLSVPEPEAFSVFTSRLPSAVKSGNFTALLALANVGRCASGGCTAFGASWSVGWKGQRKFFQQCCALAKKARWSLMFSNQGIKFDPLRLDEKSSSQNKKSHYATELVPRVVESVWTSHSADAALELVILFGDAFGLSTDEVVKQHLLHLLTSTLSVNEHHAEYALELLESTGKQIEVLKLCLASHEERHPHSYERFMLILRLMQRSFDKSSEDASLSVEKLSKLNIEARQVDHLFDVTAILSSFFSGEKSRARPELSQLRKSVETKMKKDVRGISSMLGIGSSNSTDPLRFIEDVLKESSDSATVSALAPLCRPLGLQPGYVHVRTLVVRFKSASTTYPAFKSDVLPVCERLKTHEEKALLSEWCAGHYTLKYEEENLRCLLYSLDNAFKASTELEKVLEQCTPDTSTQDLHQHCLEAIRRLSTERDKIEDRIRLRSILQGEKDHGSLPNQFVVRLLDHLEQLGKSEPEELASFLVESASDIAADLLMSNITCEPMSALRRYSDTVERTFEALSEHHSHIHPTRLARSCVKKWMQSSSKHSEAEVANADKKTPKSAEFEMDLNALQSLSSKSGLVGNTNTENEMASFRSPCLREASELETTKICIKIAFALSLSESSKDETGDQKENIKKTPAPKKEPTPLRKGLLSRLDKMQDQSLDSEVNAHAKDLLSVFFANNGSEKSSKGFSGKSYTFGIRYRALRIASMLCPQDILEQVAGPYLNGRKVSLGDCSFGSFVAKEVEELGLPLPHDDIRLLSSMKYASYARTLWRHHRYTESKRTKERLLLLLLELSLEECGDAIDQDFVQTLIKEIASLHLPRTLLLVMERVSVHFRRIGSDVFLIREDDFLQLLQSVQACVQQESHSPNAEAIVSSVSKALDMANEISVSLGWSRCLSEQARIHDMLQGLTSK